jgi:nicotinamide mononucleotide adenylyltransferase
MKYEIVPIDQLRPLEKVFPTHLANLEKMINSDGFMLKALIIDSDTGTILDGSHRYVYLLKNGFKEAPVYVIDYDSEDVRVGTHLKHRFLIKGDRGISKKECKRRGLSGDLFPPRTTRHFFTFRKADISIPLGRLERGVPVDVSDLIAEVDVSEEILHNEIYISEIKEEMEIIIQYLSEVSETKKYLEDQIKTMDYTRGVAFFPGKFHPPHIGHIQTLLNIMPKYKKLIVGVSEHLPEEVITTPDEIIDSLKLLFSYFDNVEVCKIKGTLIDREDIEDLPCFDVLLSGNPDVLAWGQKMGLKVEHVNRSCGIDCSGSNIRSIVR